MTRAHQIVRWRALLPGLLSCLIAAQADAQATSSDTTPPDGRVSSQGPYRSQMRIIDPQAPAPVLEPRDDGFGRALAGRAKGYAAARSGDIDAAIQHLQSALSADALAPLAQAQLYRDLIVLFAQRGDDEGLAAAYADARAGSGAADMALDNLVHAAAASALARLGRWPTSLAALERVAAPSPAVLRLKVVVLSRLARYGAAAALAAATLDLATEDPAPWRELIDLYRAAEDPARAVAVAELGVQSGALHALQDRRYVARLYLSFGLPDHAAVLLAQTLAGQALTRADAERAAAADLLLAAQRRAADWDAALTTARHLTESIPSSARWQALGELAARTGDSALAARAYARALDDAPVAERGRLLMALGEAHVITGNTRAARRAFSEASELGGVYQAAGQALAALAQPRRDDDNDDGDDEGPDGAPPATVASPGARAQTPARIAQRRDGFERRRIPRSRLYFGAAEAPSDDIATVAQRLASRVARSLRRERLVAAGPLRIRVADAAALAAGQPVELQVGVPVRTSLPPRGGLRNVTLPPMEAAVRRYVGPAEGLATAWATLVEDVLAAGLAPGNDARTVILSSDAAGRPQEFELQLAVGTP